MIHEYSPSPEETNRTEFRP